MKILYAFLLSFATVSVTAQGTESFTNMPAASSSYTVRTWTGDGGRVWSAGNARTDGAAAGSAVTGMTDRFIILRNTGGILSSANIPNGIGTLSFKYAKAFTAVTNPSFGVFINNVQIGATVTATSNAAVTHTVMPDIGGTFTLEIRQLTASDQGRLALDDISWTSFNAVPCAEPGAQPTNLQFTNVTATSLSGSFTVIPAVTTVENYLVVRVAGAVFNGQPVDGVSYPSGSTIPGTNGVVVGISSDGTFSDIVSPSIQYNYYVFAMNDQSCGGAPNYEQLAPLTGTVTTPALAACTTPAAPTAISFSATNTAINGTFTGSGASKYLVLRNTTGSFTGTVTNGTVYTSGSAVGNATVVSYAPGTTFTATGLTINTQYFFYVFAANDACTGEPAYSATSLDGSFSTTNNPGDIPPGYYASAAGLSCDALKTALYNIIRPTVPNPAPDYNGICNIYPATDFKTSDFSSAQVIWDMYSDNPTGNDPYEFEYGIDVDGCGGNPNNVPIPPLGEGEEYNREHSFPRSWFGGAVEPMNSDIMHIFPTDKAVNALRGSDPYGVVASPTVTTLNGSKSGTNSTAGYSGRVFEPIEAYKGDFARAQFYMITAYENLVAGWQPNKDDIFNGTSYQAFDPWYLNLMYQWHLADPVSQKEIDRNNAVYNIQGNRNPYVDHPEYVQQAFSCTGVLPVKILAFTGALVNNNSELRWRVSNEDAFANYIVERSIDGIKFDAIGTVNATNSLNYYFLDAKTPAFPVVYYRLKLVDIDARFTYSNTITIRPAKVSGIVLYPNPAQDMLQVRSSTGTTGLSTMQITDMTGRTLRSKTVPAGTVNFSVDVRTLAAGRYYLTLSGSSGVARESFVVLP